MVDQVLRTMVEYFGRDLTRTSHSLKVYGLSRMIALNEGLNAEKMLVLECAAALHDIGVPESIRTYGSAKGKYQEAMGYKVGSELMTTLGFHPDFIEKVAFLIAHHHSYDVDGGLSLQILIEADLLANLDEGGLGKVSPREIVERHFRTKCGRELFSTMLGLQPQLPENLLETGRLRLCKVSS